MKKIIAMILAALLLNACSKTSLNSPENKSRISFHNASVELTTMLSGAQSEQRVLILWDSISHSIEPDPVSGDGRLQLPFFNNSPGPLANRNLFLYPNVEYNTVLPWVTYMNAVAGMHNTGITDTAFKQLQRASISLEPDAYTSLYITDSAGTYIIISTPDERQLPDGKIRLRMAHMSASNDTVLLSLGKEKMPVFPEGVHFRQVTPYVDIPFTAAARLSIGVAGINDTQNMLLRTFIDATPGRSYTIVFKGYTQPVSYKDYTGKVRNFSANAELFIERMN